MTGFIESPLDARDIIYQGNTDLKKYENTLNPEVIDQGSKGTCCSHVIYEMYDFYCQMKGIKNTLRREEVYDLRSDKKVDGMTPREGLQILKSQGKISSYARILNPTSIKQSIIVNGIVLLALPVYNYSTKFFEGEKRIGGHAVAGCGFTEDSLIFKNSWGYSWGDQGYGELSDPSKIIEAWTILA